MEPDSWKRHPADSYQRRLEEHFYLLSYGVNDVSNQAVLITFATIKCSNDGRHLMFVVP